MNEKCQKITTKIRKKNKRNEKIKHENKQKIFIKFRKTIISNFEKRLLKISKNNYYKKFEHFRSNFHFRFFFFSFFIFTSKKNTLKFAFDLMSLIKKSKSC